ncbi:MAG: carbon-nitrogen hydrolase family protein [Planctomycetes bacterium]|nr:carbon-nitrogen hydrolase family protein [Planctomycetota bacterium]
MGKPSRRKTLRVAGAQINTAEDIAASEDKAMRYIWRAHKENADFILFPEMYLTGYTPAFDNEATEAALERIRQAARRYRINILMGTGSRHLGMTTNQVRVFSKKGELAGVHEKILLQIEKSYEPGRKLRVFDLDGLCFAVLICNDFWATPRSTHGTIPILPQMAQDLGASVIFHSISCSGEKDPAKRKILKDWHVANHRTWAMRIGITIVAANQPGPLGGPVNCGIIGPDGQYIVRTPNKGERFFLGEI